MCGLVHKGNTTEDFVPNLALIKQEGTAANVLLDHMLPRENETNPIDILPYMTRETPLDLIPLLLVNKHTYTSGKSYYDRCVRLKGQSVEEDLLTAMRDLFLFSKSAQNDLISAEQDEIIHSKFLLKIFAHLLKIENTEFYKNELESELQKIPYFCRAFFYYPIQLDPLDIFLWDWKKKPRTLTDYQFLLENYQVFWKKFSAFKAQYAEKFDENAMMKTLEGLIDNVSIFLLASNQMQNILPHANSTGTPNQNAGLGDFTRPSSEKNKCSELNNILLHQLDFHDRQHVQYLYDTIDDTPIENYQKLAIFYEKIQQNFSNQKKQHIIQCAEFYPPLKDYLNIFQNIQNNVERLNNFADQRLEKYFSRASVKKQKETFLSQLENSVYTIHRTKSMLDSYYDCMDEECYQIKTAYFKAPLSEKFEKFYNHLKIMLAIVENELEEQIGTQNVVQTNTTGD